MPRHYVHPMFSQKHYEAIAETLGGQYHYAIQYPDASESMIALIEDFVDIFKADNSAFDPEKFRKAVEGR